jgi:hypothetical protein
VAWFQFPITSRVRGVRLPSARSIRARSG